MSFKTTFTLSEVYNKQLSGIWPTAFYDYFEKTSLLIGTNETTFITDASTNKWALTPLASVNLLKAKNEHPYQPGYYSTNFNGSSYLTVPTTTGFTLSGDFTIECWAYMNSYASSGGGGPTFLSGTNAANNWLFAIDATAIYWYWNQAGVLTATVANTTGEWVHLAVSRSGSTVRIFKNGMIVGTATNSSSYTLNNSVLYIGSQNTTVGLINGYISNLRVVKGTAVYTTAFVPPTAPLTAIQGTVLLTCMDSYHAERITPNSITAVGVPSIGTFTPFSSSIPSIYSSYGSANINNSSLNNTAFTGANFGTSADFTIESWMKWGATTASNHTSYEFNGTTRTIIGRSSTGLRLFLTGTEKGFAYTFIPNVWYHIAIVRSLLTYYVYINGVLATTAFTHAGNHSYTTLTIGRNFDTAEIAVGLSLSDFRIVNGTAVYGGNFIPPTAPLTAIRDTTLLTFQNDKEIANSTFYDDSSMKNLLTTAGTPTQGTVSPISPAGWSGHFDGSSYFLTAPANSALSMGTGDFTWEMWIYPTSSIATNAMLFGYRSGSNTSPFLFYSTTGIVFGDDTANIITYTGGVPPIGSWTHIAISRAGTALKMFVNGSLAGSATNSTNFSDASLRYIGAMNTSTSYYFPGYISNLRIVKGTAVYTTNFTPPTAPLTAIPGTSLLTLQDNRFKDNSINDFAITSAFTPKVQPFSPFYPSQKTIGTTVDYVGNSTYFPSNSDYLTMSMGDGQMFRTSDFTVEMWVYSTAVTHNILMMPSGTTGSWSIVTYNGNLYWQQNNSNLLNVGPVALNAWSHFAICRVSDVLKVFINGVQLYSAANTFDYTNNSTTRTIAFPNAPAFYMSNLRVVKGTAVYTKTFTPPTAPLTAIPGTVLLTCQDSLFRDNSVNALTITRTGSPQISTVTPFTTTTSTSYDILDNGSMYFNGSTDYLSTLGNTSYASSDFTVEGWLNVSSVSGSATRVIQYQNGTASNSNYAWFIYINTGTVTGGVIDGTTQYTATNLAAQNLIPNTWSHFAFVKRGTSMQTFVNGIGGTVVACAATINNPAGSSYYIGSDTTTANYAGYISGLRVVKGTALYIAPFTPSTVLRDVPGTVLLLKGNNAGIYDATGRNNLITLGDAKTSQVNKKYGNNSLYFDGTGDYLKMPTPPNFFFGTGDFTIECWAYFNSTGTQAIITDINGTNGQAVWGMFYNSTEGLRLVVGAASVTYSFAWTLSVSTWYHITITRSGTNLRAFINGTQLGTTQTSSFDISRANSSSGEFFYIGNFRTLGASAMNGYIDDMRVISGVAKYTAAFTPPPRLGLVP